MKKYKKRKNAKPIGFRDDKMYNAPPSDISVQEIPRSLKEFIQLKESAKDTQNDRRKVKSRSTKPTTPVKPPNTLKKTKETSLSKKQTGPHSVLNIETNVVVCRKNRTKQKKKLKFKKLEEKRKEKKLKNKMEIELDKGEIVKENIQFGDVAHRPPQLSVLPRKVAVSGFQRRPGRKDDLLLKSILKRKYSK